MEKKRKDLNVPDPSEFCGDGGCGCGCGGLIEIKEVLSQEKIQEIPSSGELLLKEIGNLTERKGVGK